jgi:hypothetical protein
VARTARQRRGDRGQGRPPYAGDSVTRYLVRLALRTGIAFDVLAGYDWQLLHTFEEVAGELSNHEQPVDGTSTLIQMSQRFGG